MIFPFKSKAVRLVLANAYVVAAVMPVSDELSLNQPTEALSRLKAPSKSGISINLVSRGYCR